MTGLHTSVTCLSSISSNPLWNFNMALQLTDKPTWTKFLKDAGIPAADAAAYAVTFVEQRISATTLLDLTADHLSSLGIKVLGDVLAILRHAKTLDTTTTPSTVVKSDEEASKSTNHTYRPPPATVKLPSITAEMTHPQFRKLRIDWDVYKKVTNLPHEQIGPLLYSTCDSNVQTNLINSKSEFFKMNESDMLTAIENIVTKRINPAVHRMNFSNIIQHEGESIQEYLTRLRSSAVDCEFSCPSCDVDISHVNIKDQFIRGLVDDTLQTDILAKASQLKSVEDIVKHAEAWEGALRDQSKLQTHDAELSRISDYRRKKNNTGYNKNHKLKCSGCGSTTHGIPGKPPRHSHCTAWGKECTHCKSPNHFSTVCRQEGAAANSLIAHVRYDDNSGIYTSTDSLQEIPANLTPDITNSVTSIVHIFPDSGANICLAGPKQQLKMRLKNSQLRPCKKRVNTVGGSQLVCNGWIPVKFEIGENNTIQPVYFCEKVDKLYFGKQACIDMNILPPSYPMPMPNKIPETTVNTICSTTYSK